MKAVINGKIILKDRVLDGFALIFSDVIEGILPEDKIPQGIEIIDAKGEKYEGLGLFDFTVTEQERTRNTADAIFTMEGSEHPLVGFINKCSTIHGIDAPLFQVKMGLGNETTGAGEGITYKNFYGTHLTGPMLIKNPYFLMKLASDLCGKEMNGDYLNYEKAGYEITLRELTKRMEN